MKTMHMRISRQTRTKAPRRAEPPFWMMLLLYVALFVASELLRPKPELENAKRAGFDEFQFPTATEGRSVPLLWGTNRIDGPNVVWYGNIIQEAITEKIKTGLFSSERITKGYRSHVGIQFALCRGDAAGSLKLNGVWIGEDRVFTGSVVDNGTFTIDEPELFGGDELGNGGVVGTMRFHAGSATQTADSYLSTFQQEGGDTPAYRGTCYICPSVRNVYVGNSTTIKPWKFELSRFPNGLSLTGNKHIINTWDANPANVIYEIFTDTDWGLAYSSSEIDLTSFVDAAETLYDEGNGISFVLDNATDASEVIRLIEEQIDGVLFFNQSENKWQLKLIRSDYVLASLDPVDETNSKLINYSRGSWSNTTNIVRVQFNDRGDEYKQTFAPAQDGANIRIQGGVNITATRVYPGVKTASVANNLAWRDLRALSYPLAKTKVEVDRSFWATVPGDIFRFSHTYLGIEDLAMRVQRIDYGALEDNKIVLDLVQDVFYSAAPSFADAPNSGWGDPLGALSAFASTEQVAFEAPRALVRRDPDTSGELLNKIYVAARQNGVATNFEIRQRNSPGVISGSFAENGVVTQFCKIGELNSALTTKSAYPLSTLLVTATPDSQADILEAIPTAVTLDELGTQFINLILIDEEFMLVVSSQSSGGDVQLNNVYRGALDTVQADHASGAEVFILSAGGGISDADIAESNNVEVKLVPFNYGAELLEASATTISLTFDKRIRRPYPPSLLSLNAVNWDTTAVSLEGGGSAGAENLAIDLVVSRRDYRIADNISISEIDQLGSDAANIFSDFPSANSTDHDIEVRHDPSGSNDLVLTDTFSGATYELLRIAVLEGLNGSVPTGDLRVTITASHTDNGDVLTSRQSLVHDFAIASALTGQFEFGLLPISTTSALYTATVNGNYAFTLSSAFTAGDVEYRVNGGSWTAMITAGNTSGSIIGIVSTDTIEVRHTSIDGVILKQLDMNAPGAGQDGFAIFV